MIRVVELEQLGADVLSRIIEEHPGPSRKPARPRPRLCGSAAGGWCGDEWRRLKPWERAFIVTDAVLVAVIAAEFLVFWLRAYVG